MCDEIIGGTKTVPGKVLQANVRQQISTHLNVCTWKTFSITLAIFIETLNSPWRKKVMEN